jgi:hypothetical protein
MQWRVMTPEELATRPEARLGGALRWIVVLAALIVILPALGFALMFAAIWGGSVHSGPIEYLIGMYGGIVELGLRYTIVIMFIIAWSALFLVMTFLRLPATPAVAGAGLVIWMVLRFAAAYVGTAVVGWRAGRDSIAALLIYQWPLLMELLGDLAMAAAFCGYMAAGVRPNAYYRRRLPAP